MWCVLAGLLLTSLVAVSAREDDEDGHHGGLGLRGSVEPRLLVSGVRLMQLDDQMEELDDRLKNAEDITTAKDFIDNLNARLYHVEDSPCDHRHMVCGDHSVQCVHDLLVCDGHEDCHNGYDEREDICNYDRLKVGTVYVGHIHWISCFRNPDHATRMEVISSERSKFMGARVWLKLKLTQFIERPDGKMEEFDLMLVGQYSFASRNFTLVQEKYTGSGMIGLCHFHGDGSPRTECLVKQLATSHVCATAVYVKEED